MRNACLTGDIKSVMRETIGMHSPDDFAPYPDEKTSHSMQRMIEALPAEQVTVDLVLSMLRRRSFGGLFLLLAALSLVPGLSFFAGLAMLLPGFQMAVGLPSPSLPRIIGDIEIPAERLKSVTGQLVPWLQKMERYVKPRWLAMTKVPMPNLLGLLIAALSLVIMLPLPFSNLPPAVAVFILALALLEKDGMMILSGLVMSAVALTIGLFVVYVAYQSLGTFL